MKRIFTLFGLVLLATVVMAQSKLSGYSQMMLNEYRAVNELMRHDAKAVMEIAKSKDGARGFAARSLKKIGGRSYVDAIVRVADEAQIGELEALGVKPGVKVGDCLTAQIPLDAMNAVI